MESVSAVLAARQGSLARIAAAALVCAGFAACVSQEKYRETLESCKLYQRMYHDSEAYQGQLEAELDALRAQLALQGEPGPVEANYTELDDRLAELRAMEQRLAGMSDGGVQLVTFDGGYGYRLDESILFDSGSSEIRAEGRPVLEELARSIRSRPYDLVTVRGHTDTDPIVRPQTKERFPHGNLQLSAARAVEVAALLLQGGALDTKRVAVAGFGPNEPVAANDSAANKQKNRRVEVYVKETEK